MIIVTLNFMNVVTTHNFKSLTDALVFARSKEINTIFQIRKNGVLLAKGKIEDFKGDLYGY